MVGKARKKSGGGKAASLKSSRRKSISKKQRKDVKFTLNSAERKAIAGGEGDGKRKANPFDMVFAKKQKNSASIGSRNNWRDGPQARTSSSSSSTKLKSMEIRKRTLDVEFQRRHKANQILDRRIGQRDVQLSEEARAEKRFLFQQKKLIEMKTVESSEADSKDQSTESTTKRVTWKDFDDNDEPDDDDDEELNAGDEHGEGEDHANGLNRKNRKDSLAETVAHDRRLRAIKSMLRDEQEEQTEHLDKCYREMCQLGMIQSGSREGSGTAKQPDPYDSMYQVLQFEPAGPVERRKVAESSKLGGEKPASSTFPVEKPSNVHNSKDFDEHCNGGVEESVILDSTAHELDGTSANVEKTVEREQIGLRLLEPRVEEHFNPERRGKGKSRGGSANAKEREKKWASRVRKERRGAIKELRKDARHLAGLYADQQRKQRRERDEKTKRIMQTLEVQESEHKKLRAIAGKR